VLDACGRYLDATEIYTGEAVHRMLHANLDPDAMKERGLRSRDVPRHSRGAHFHDEGGPCERSLCG
jgi:hypothetical protein